MDLVLNGLGFIWWTGGLRGLAGFVWQAFLAAILALANFRPRSNLAGRLSTTSLSLERRVGHMVGCGCVRGCACCRYGSGLVRRCIRSIHWVVDVLVRLTVFIVIVPVHYRPAVFAQFVCVR